MGFSDDPLQYWPIMSVKKRRQEKNQRITKKRMTLMITETKTLFGWESRFEKMNLKEFE